MRIAPRFFLALFAAACILPAWAQAQDAGRAPTDRRTKETPNVHLVATAHLDTQWRWTIQDVIRDYIPATLRQNFALFEQHPDYVFSFEGAFRYQLMKEYYPEEYARLKEYIAAGRWKVAGSWLDAVDVNLPAPESMIRHALYGNGFFRREFDTVSRDVFLPDCFGFGYSLPAAAAHSGLLGFSTQKLGWGSAVGVPFDVGLWKGVDGAHLIAALNPGSYVSNIEHDLSADSALIAMVERQRAVSGFPVAMKYFGTGDQGGSPTPSSVAWMERSVNGPGPLRVANVASDRLARDLGAQLGTDLGTGLRANLDLGPLARLPLYDGELLMTDHGTGCYSSQAAMKRWNRKNERLADAAERVAVAAHWLGGARYPHATLLEAWTRFLWHQFHDDITGTSIPEAYVFSWNDEALSQNQFADVLQGSVAAVARAMDTEVRRGEPLLVYNPLAIEREDIVEAQVRFAQGSPRAVRVYDSSDREVPAQSYALPDGRTAIVFLAKVPPVGFALYELRASMGPGPDNPELRVDSSGLENHRYRVSVDERGDIASIFDKVAGRELLAAPLRLQLLADSPSEWAAWEVDYDDIMAQPRPVAGPQVNKRIAEEGPARATLVVERGAAGSTFVQRISLAAGAAGDQLVITTEIDWRTPGTMVKAAFPLAARNRVATYDLRLGTIERPVNAPKLYEVPAQQWADLTEEDGSYGIAVLNDCRYGWDRPDATTLRLTLVRTPEVNDRWQWIRDQASQDFGHHRVTYAVYGHAGDWRDAGVAWQAERLNQPLLAFRVPAHRGWLGNSFSFVHFDMGGAGTAFGDWETNAPTGTGAELPPVAIRALKLAEDGDEIVIRVQEISGRAIQDCGVRFAAPIAIMREMNGAEEPLQSEAGGAAGPASVSDGVLRFALGPYQLRTFALRLSPAQKMLEPPVSEVVSLPYNVDGISDRNDPTDGDFDGQGHTLPADLLPEVLYSNGVAFRMGPRAPGWANALACQGQRIMLPAGSFDRLYVLAASVEGDRSADFGIEPAYVDNYRQALWMQDWAAPVGQWNNRVVMGEVRGDPDRIAPAYVKPATVGWVGAHRHDRAGAREPYAQAYLFRYAIDLAHETRSIVLPNDPGLRIVAMTAASNSNDGVVATTPLSDAPVATSVSIEAPMTAFIGSTRVHLTTPIPGAGIHYTLDGTRPVPESPRYAGPIELKATTTVKARAFAAGIQDGYVAEATFTLQAPRAAMRPATVQPGLTMYGYAGEWTNLPGFTETPRSVDIVATVGIHGPAEQEHFGLVFEGFLRVPREGMYTFYLGSDDGSALSIGNDRLIDNDGLHSHEIARGHIALGAGLHPLRVEYFQGQGGASLDLEWEGPGIARGPVPAEALGH
ncbi:MAG: glycoside hydrolase family 38 C-terminal domain-containing protein [Candidatus Eisenbacteria bacterium]